MSKRNIKVLREELDDIFDKLQSGNMDVGQAKELNNTAGKIINTIKVQLEYASLCKKEPKIDYLDV